MWGRSRAGFSVDGNQAMVIPSGRKGGNRNGSVGHGHRNSIPHSSAQPTTRLYDACQGTASHEDTETLKLNVGGQSFRVRVVSLFSRGEDGRLVQFARLSHEDRVRHADAYLEATEEFFFERSSVLFDAIFKFYISGQLHRPLDVCPQEFAQELLYWRIPESYLAPCCWRGYSLSSSLDDLTDGSAKNRKGPPRTLREKLYRFTEGDGTLPSTLFTFASISFVLVSVIGLVMGSIHDFQVPIIKEKNGTAKTIVNSTLDLPPEEYSANDPNVIWEPHPAFGYVETVCILWFTYEYIFRITVAPNRIAFLCSLMNIVDLVAIVPFYLELILAICGIDFGDISDIKGALLVVRVLRVLRVVRILKLGRYSSGMRTFALTLKSSARQLGMMGMVLSTGVVFFSTLLYFVEKDEVNTPFTSIPAAFWWAIVTMTTVGYGDYVPVTVPGKLIASGAIISGVLVLALPITIIVDNFMKVSGNGNQNSFFSSQREEKPEASEAGDV